MIKFQAHQHKKTQDHLHLDLTHYECNKNFPWSKWSTSKSYEQNNNTVTPLRNLGGWDGEIMQETLQNFNVTHYL